MDEKEHKLPPGMLPLPPGMASRPGKPPPPPLPKPPSFPAAPFAAQPQPFAAAQPSGPSPEIARMSEEKDKLEKKISEMEKTVAQEKEKALLAALKNQQDEALSSRVESSLKDIQDKMRRDRRDSQVEEERIALKGKVKEMESRLAAERETWMQTLKNQLSERETQGKDVEGHFINRLQEMERRWLDEKAHWQKELSAREETIRSLKSDSGKLRDTQDEYRRLSMEKEMSEREISRLREDVARSDREKASIESYIKALPEKERELAEIRAENSILRMREEKLKEDARHVEEKRAAEEKHREERHASEVSKLQAETGRLQAEIGSLSDRKNAEKNEEIKKAQAVFEAQLQDKERTLAEVAGDKMRAISELLKVKGFVARVQAINAAMDKERGQLKLDKMQLAATMGAQLEEIKKYRQELDNSRSITKEECEKVKVVCEKAREDYGAQLAKVHQEELARLSNSHQTELTKLAARHQAELDAGMFQMRTKYDAAVEDEKTALKRKLEDDYTKQLKEARMAALSAEGAKATMDTELRKLSGALSYAETTLAARQKEYDTRVSKLEIDLRRNETLAADMAALKAEAEKRLNDAAAQQTALTEQYAALDSRKGSLESELTALKENYRIESENRSRFESELLFLKQKIQQMDLQTGETAAMIESERAAAAARDAETMAQLEASNANISELSSQLEVYKDIERSLGNRLKWALKGKAS
ncbi:MAG: hypothetical protein COT18_07640 [Elusimicrobia bacterium CG08_land_8_20_14_0_20_59_10]|nr:MAG: hypothetical protein COT18_07640 [Elusimicrobia bacterium CG08_land_8_20_14_0_20_59_10]